MWALLGKGHFFKLRVVWGNMKTIRTFMFMGRPGCGKGTQTDLLLEKYPDFEMFSMGAQFRAISNEDSFLGRKIKSIIDAGMLSPHWFASYLFKHKILHLAPEAGVIFEGVARKEAESRDFHETMEWLERPYRVIHLDVPQEVIRERLEERGKTSGRIDDHKKSIDTRLEEYEKHTALSLAYLRDEGMVVDIDGTKSPAEIHQSILAALEKLP